MARNPSGGAARNTAQIDRNLKQATNSARSLAFATAGVTGQLNGAVGASAAIAENIAKVSSNAKIAASATGIGAVVAILGTIAAFTVNWKKETEEVVNKLRDVRNATAQLEAQAKGNKRLERELEIQNAMDGELDAAKKMEHFYRKFPELQDAIRRKAAAARDALSADVKRNFNEFGSSITDNIHPAYSGLPGQRERDIREYQLQLQRQQRQRELDKLTAAAGGLKGRPDNQKEFDRIYDDIDNEFKQGMSDLEYDLGAPARQLGDSLGRSIVGGISDGISAALHGGIGSGLKALTGSILIGFGEMMQEIGTQSLLAAQLLKKVIDAFRAFAPEGAIAASLELIAGGALLKTLGASMQGSRGGGSGGGVASSGRSALLGSVVGIGSAVAAAGGPSAFTSPGASGGGLWVIGADDVTAQRVLATMVDKGNARRGRR
jgi:hypothetical protein